MRFVSLLLLGAAVAGGVTLLQQRQAAALLRAELDQARDEQREIMRLRAENAQIAAALPSADALAALRSDHAAVIRLRSELEKLKDTVQAREKALAAADRPKGN